VTGKGDVRERNVLGRAKWNEYEGWRTREHQDWLCNIIDQHIKFHLSDDLWTFLTPLILISAMTHYDSHTALRQYPTPHQVKSIGSSHLSIFILIFPWWVTVFSFYTHFLLIYHRFIMLFEKELLNIPLTHWWAIAYRSQKCCLIHSGFPHV